MIKKNKAYLNNPNLPAVGAQFAYTPEQVQEIMKCQQDIFHFAEKYFHIITDGERKTIPLHPYQKDALQMICDSRFSILLFSRQTGKALALDTPVPTPNGWTTMGDLNRGDKVYSSNGSVCTVTHAHEVLHGRDCFEVVFDNGEKIIADSEHQWFTQTAHERDGACVGSVKTTKQILETLEESNHRIKLPTNTTDAFVHNIPVHKGYCSIRAVNPVESVPVRCITVDSSDHLFLVGRQYVPTHNSTIATIFLLWHAIFNNDQHILLVANKEDTAKEIFSRVRLAFEELPLWLKPGVKEYGKEGMELANGSRVKITTTTSSAGRGSSCNVLFMDEADHVDCVTGDTIITLRDTHTGDVLQLPIEQALKLMKNE